MIKPRTTVSPWHVADHYDELDRFYLDLWGEHLHHGLWLTGDESPEAAAGQLVDLVGSALRLHRGERVCDIGCGYGATARRISRDFDVRVTGITISPRQYEYACVKHQDASVGGPFHTPQFVLGDFLDADFPTGSFDAAVAIECASHMSDPQKFAERVAQLLAPGGRFAMIAWLASDQPDPRERKYLLEPICREGRLCHLLSAREYIRHLEVAGLEVVHFRDISPYVRRTWSVVLQRTMRRLVTRWSYIRFLFDSRHSNRIFLVTILRMWTAYRVGALRYGVFLCRKAVPGRKHPANVA